MPEPQKEVKKLEIDFKEYQKKAYACNSEINVRLSAKKWAEAKQKTEECTRQSYAFYSELLTNQDYQNSNIYAPVKIDISGEPVGYLATQNLIDLLQEIDGGKTTEELIPQVVKTSNSFDGMFTTLVELRTEYPDFYLANYSNSNIELQQYYDFYAMLIRQSTKVLTNNTMTIMQNTF